MITGKSIAKGALIVMAATLLSRVFGFIREMIIAKYFGLSGVTDAYLVAFTVPSAVAMAISAAVSAGFIPVLNNYMVTEDRNNESEVTNTLLNFTFLTLLVVVSVSMIFAPLLVKLLAPGFHRDSVLLTIRLIRIMFPALIFISLMGLSSGFLNTRQHFLFPALAPIITSLFVIGSAVVLGPSMGIKGLAIGTMVGSAGQFLIQIPVMYKKGFRYKPVLTLSHPGVIRSLKLMTPVLIASMAPPLLLLIERGLASKLNTGSISALNYAFRLMQLPQGLFVMAVSVPLFPALSSFAAQRDFERLKQMMVKGLGILAIIMIPASAGLVALNVPIVRLLFERGAFEAKDTLPTAYALTFYALALLPLAFRDIFRRGFYAVQDTLTPVLITVLSFGINVILDLLLVKIMGIGGLAFGAAISVLIEVTVLYYIFNKKIDGLFDKQFALMLVKLLISSIIMGVSAFVCSDIIGAKLDLTANISRVIQVGTSIVFGLTTYLLTVAFLKVELAAEAWNIIKRQYRKLSNRHVN